MGNIPAAISRWLPSLGYAHGARPFLSSAFFDLKDPYQNPKPQDGVQWGILQKRLDGKVNAFWVYAVNHMESIDIDEEKTTRKGLPG